MTKGEGVQVTSEFPFEFDGQACKACGGKCCRGSTGYVWVTVAEVKRMAARRRMAMERFSDLYLRKVQGRMSLQERDLNGDYVCCFLDPATGECSVYEDRPKQCQTFPFWDEFKSDAQPLFLECPGVTEKER